MKSIFIALPTYRCNRSRTHVNFNLLTIKKHWTRAGITICNLSHSLQYWHSILKYLFKVSLLRLHPSFLVMSLERHQKMVQELGLVGDRDGSFLPPDSDLLWPFEAQSSRWKLFGSLSLSHTLLPFKQLN